MPSIPLHPPSKTASPSTENGLPKLLHTPSGLAILEIQGTIHTQPGSTAEQPEQLPLGKLIFPHYSPEDPPENTAWMKRAHLYIGKHQRLTGEVKKLPKPLGVIRRREGMLDEAPEELEIVDIIKYKIVFSHRPEPVS
ncbi:uncharacterized protein K452DRAFT_268560 [Aplosporella prunicola CBS 121167]|uniref:Chromosome transmission fidelity protein 8 n=1 Tax=Aplosporella prunicola CBS 121167 TaxID=1176127 RepID=A0A6A6BGB5_9PEZI|nr:uncharacterized protein K452DRAFT_268560 [Aplosporella prunicola CBS 121167]KAF2143212.1 hypothetical protein K452DRAFT_268560 [Aplosporella prunicola CBS 121167]